jgi:hypothetical protein
MYSGKTSLGVLSPINIHKDSTITKCHMLLTMSRNPDAMTDVRASVHLPLIAPFAIGFRPRTALAFLVSSLAGAAAHPALFSVGSERCGFAFLGAFPLLSISTSSRQWAA